MSAVWDVELGGVVLQVHQPGRVPGLGDHPRLPLPADASLQLLHQPRDLLPLQQELQVPVENIRESVENIRVSIVDVEIEEL